MYCKYGDYRHPDNEVSVSNFQMLPQRSARGKQWALLYRVHLKGEILVDQSSTTPELCQADLKAKIGDLIDAYSVNGQDFTLFHDNDAPSHHRLINNSDAALSDVYVAHREWPDDQDGEYATKRTYYIILEQLVAAAESQILHYGETVSVQGTGGSWIEWVQTPSGVAIPQVVHATATQKILQRGKVVALQGWPFAYVRDPLLPLYEHKHLRLMDYEEPRFTGRQYTHYGISWAYHMEVPTTAFVLPNLPGF